MLYPNVWFPWHANQMTLPWALLTPFRASPSNPLLPASRLPGCWPSPDNPEHRRSRTAPRGLFLVSGGSSASSIPWAFWFGVWGPDCTLCLGAGAPCRGSSEAQWLKPASGARLPGPGGPLLPCQRLTDCSVHTRHLLSCSPNTGREDGETEARAHEASCSRAP